MTEETSQNVGTGKDPVAAELEACARTAPGRKCLRQVLRACPTLAESLASRHGFAMGTAGSCWTAEEDELLLAAAALGMTYRQMSCMTGRSAQAVRQRIKQLSKTRPLQAPLVGA